MSNAPRGTLVGARDAGVAVAQQGKGSIYVPAIDHSRLSRAAAIGLAIFIGLQASTGSAIASHLKVIHSFCAQANCTDGEGPAAPLIGSPTGDTLYGTTAVGGGGANGTVFEIRASGGYLKFKSIYSFCESGGGCATTGSQPFAPVIEDVNGNLYGTTEFGGSNGANGSGVVFELSPQSGKDGTHWVETVLYNFCGRPGCADGDNPSSPLSYAGQTQGNLYDGVSPLFGLTFHGGASGAGAVYELLPNNGAPQENVLYSFCPQGGPSCSDGFNPGGGLVLDASGNIFGSTLRGGGNKTRDYKLGGGTVFELVANGPAYNETLLYRFCSETKCADGAQPMGPLWLGADGAIYSTTLGGGRACQIANGRGCGTVFELVPQSGAYKELVLHAFCARSNCADGWQPAAGLVKDGAGNLFGTTAYGGGNNNDQLGLGGGTVFEINGNSLKTLHRFCAENTCTDGEYPSATVYLDGLGHAFGTTFDGGAAGQSVIGGTVFELTPS